ncbi:MAG: LysM peptidoglycan-binding domain-containing protein [Saprospiraceae bacterium]|nr:LysM peptidoglycan-binding domain-containing protein [Saprospiraceae bacterium]
MHKLFSTGLFTFLTLYSSAQDMANIYNFIDRYREIAIEEMHRTGIPASIKLAQAILESDAGQSDLALNSNNHFGLKCGVEWDGPTYYKKDDDLDRRGRLIPSCFRAFATPEESFVAHSDFLMDPRKAYRYSFLFDLDPLDYKSWAWGLKQAGYATNPRYALLLINLIETYELYTYDYYQPQSLLASASTAPTPPPKPTYQHTIIQKRQVQSPEWKNEPEKIPNIEGVITNNGLDMVYARAEDTPEDIAKRYNRSLKDIITFNEKIKQRDQVLTFTERVYFEKKKSRYKGSIKYHTVEEGQTMYDIAQTYGIRLEKLYVRNRMFPGTEPAIGERVKLRGMVKSKDRPKLRHVPSKDLASEEVKPLSRIDRAVGRKQHIVSSGDTLYGIARQYRMSVETLKQLNKLDSNLIKPGQILFID